MDDVELIGLKKKYRDVVAVDDVSLNIKKGEFVFLLGPSGCGKTTTLRMIGGLEEPTQGTIFIHGKNVIGVPPEKRSTSTVFQRWALFPHMTIGQNVGFGLQMKKLPKAEVKKQVGKYLEMVNLSGYGNRYPNQLSGGEKQRVALARALIVEPDVLLLDEPLSALDLKLRQRMRFEIKRIQNTLKVTTIFVTHDQTEALAMADRIVVMDKGRIDQIGTPSEVYFNPKTKFVSDFIGEMNFIPGKVEDITDHGVTVGFYQKHRITLPPTASPRRGDEVTIGIRPEKISMVREPTASEGSILLECRLEEVTFLGQLLRFHVNFEGAMLIIDEFGGMGQVQRFQQAGRVYMEIDPKDCILIAD